MGEIELRAPAVGAKMWCLFFCFSVSLRWISFDAVFKLFSEEIALSEALTVLIFVVRWRHNIREIAVKNSEKSKNGGKVCAHYFVSIAERFEKKFHRSSLGPRM